MYGGEVGVPGGMRSGLTCSTMFARWYGGDSGEKEPITLCRLCGLVDMRASARRRSSRYDMFVRMFDQDNGDGRKGTLQGEALTR